jgi:hypothetical protein
VISPLEEEPELPETYAVAPSGQLLVHSPMAAELPRLVSMKVPSGLNIAQLESTSGDLVWSKLLDVEPGVVTLVGTH